MVTAKIMLAFIFSIVTALGITLIIGAIAAWLVESLWFSRLLVPATFGVAAVGMLWWLLRASSVGGTITRFRYVAISECLAFGVLGMLMAAAEVYSLFD